MRLSAIVPVLLFPAFGVVAGAEYDNRPEALLAAMGTAPAEVVGITHECEKKTIFAALYAATWTCIRQNLTEN